MVFTVLRNKNDWLLDYEEQTFDKKLRDELTRGIFEEHSKYKQTYNIKETIEKITSIPVSQRDIIMKNIDDTILEVYEQHAKKSLVVCLDPDTMEIQKNGIGSSSLLFDELTNKVYDNLILDNFGLWFAAIMSGIVNGTGSTSATFKDTAGATNAQPYIYINTGTGGSAFNTSGAAGDIGAHIQMGSGSTAPVRADYKIQTALGSAPESAKILCNVGAYTAQNTVVYQADANPTGGSGTVNEIVTIMKWWCILPVTQSFHDIAVAHDAVTPAVTYAAGKLLRGAYSWQL